MPRIVLVVREPIPELVEMLARAGAHVTIAADDAEYPVSVTAHLGPEALDILTRHPHRLVVASAALSPEVLRALLRVLGFDEPPHPLRLVE